jgi:hypothetical protein
MFRLTGQLQWAKGFSLLKFRDNTQTLHSVGTLLDEWSAALRRDLYQTTHTPTGFEPVFPATLHALELATTGICRCYHLLSLNSLSVCCNASLCPNIMCTGRNKKLGTELQQEEREDMGHEKWFKRERNNFSSFGIGGMSMCKIHIKGKGFSTHAMKTFGRTEVYIHLFLTLALVKGERSASCPDRFTSRTFAPRTLWLWGLDGARVSLHAWKNTDVALPGTEPRLVSCSCHYYDMIYDMIHLLTAIG